MATKMLIEAAHPEETRVVVVKGQQLEEFDFEATSRAQLKGNIYLAKVTRVEPSLQAAFIEYGGNRHGFLAFNEIHPDYYQIPVADREALLAAEAKQQAEAEAAAEAKASATRDDVMPLQDIAATPASNASADMPAPTENAEPAPGFTFFKKRGATKAGQSETANPEDDVFLLGLEQEMLATRQLYLDGLISKEVYVTETRALYDKAQTRMT